MWNLLGATLVLAAAGMAGFVVARSYSERPALLRALQGALTMLLTEISYGATPLPEALARVARHTPPPAADFFAAVRRLIDGPERLAAAAAWRGAVAGQRRRWCLTETDEAVLLDLAPYIGQTSAADQEKHLRLALTQLARQQQEASAEAAVHTRLWRYLGVCAGGLLVLLLF